MVFFSSSTLSYFSFFKIFSSTFKRHSNFSQSIEKQTIYGAVKNNSMSSVQFERSGDLLATKGSGSELAVFASTEDDSHAFEFENGLTGFTRHYFDSVLISEEIGALDRVVGVAFPVVTTVGQRGVDATLSSVRVAAHRVNLRNNRYVSTRSGYFNGCPEAGRYDFTRRRAVSGIHDRRAY